jgi:hypothetical protein
MGLLATGRSSKPVRGKAVGWRASLHMRTSKYGLRVGISPQLERRVMQNSSIVPRQKVDDSRIYQAMLSDGHVVTAS